MDDPFLALLDPVAAATALEEEGMPPVFSSVNLFRATMAHPPIGRIMGDVVGAIVMDSVLDARTREVAILRVGWRIGSVYEWSNHVPIARRAGMSDEEIAAVREEEPSRSLLSELDRCAIAVVDEVLGGVEVSPPTLASARALIGDDRAVLELLTIPGLYRTIGTLLLSGAVPLEDHVEPWPPDGRSPDAGTVRGAP